MGFRNAIVSGLTLVREAIQSIGYVPGSSGWAINRDGSAEFSDATVRGELDVSSPSGQHVRINSSGLLPQIIFTSADGTKEAVINAAADETLAGDRAWLGMNPSPKIDSDLVERKGRLFLLGSQSRLEVVRQSDQLFDGGHLFLDKDQTFIATGTVDARAAIQVARIYVLLKGQAFVSADAVTRQARTKLQDDTIRLEVVDNASLQNKGGKVLLLHSQGIFGYHDVTGGIDNHITVFNDGIWLTVTDGVLQFITDVPTTSSRLLRDGNSILPNVGGLPSVNATLDSTVSATYVTMLGLEFDWTKHFSDTRIQIDVGLDAFSQGHTVQTNGVWGVSIDGAAANDVTKHSWRSVTGNEYTAVPYCSIFKGGVASGQHHFALQWRRTSGDGTLSVDGACRVSFKVTEIAP